MNAELERRLLKAAEALGELPEDQTLELIDRVRETLPATTVSEADRFVYGGVVHRAGQFVYGGVGHRSTKRYR